MNFTCLCLSVYVPVYTRSEYQNKQLKMQNKLLINVCIRLSEVVKSGNLKADAYRNHMQICLSRRARVCKGRGIRYLIKVHLHRERGEVNEGHVVCVKCPHGKLKDPVAVMGTTILSLFKFQIHNRSSTIYDLVTCACRFVYAGSGAGKHYICLQNVRFVATSKS